MHPRKRDIPVAGGNIFANNMSRLADCGSSLYTELEVMADAVCIKAGGIDDKEVRDFKKTSVEFYCKDRMSYSKAVEGAEQKPVSLIREVIGDTKSADCIQVFG